MKIENEINAEILMEINKSYSELSKYIEEIPVKIPNTSDHT